MQAEHNYRVYTKNRKDANTENRTQDKQTDI